MDSDSGLNFEGAYAIMLGGGFGVQIDGMHSSIGTTEFAGGGAQVFWQNNSPWLASLGFASVHGEFVESQEASVGLEYQQPWYSVGAKFGYAQVAYDGTVPFIDDKDNSLLTGIHADFYASETLRASLGIEYRFDLFFAKAELEWLTPVDGLSVFANCMVGENDYDHALIGLRYYIGGDSGSLKGRRQTPRPMSPGVVYAMGNQGALYNSRGKKYVAANPAAGGTFSSSNYGSSSQATDYDLNFTVVGIDGNGNIVFSGTNTYGGVIKTGSSSALLGSGVLTGGNLVLGGGSILGPGSSPGTLQITGNSSTFSLVSTLTAIHTNGALVSPLIFD